MKTIDLLGDTPLIFTNPTKKWIDSLENYDYARKLIEGIYLEAPHATDKSEKFYAVILRCSEPCIDYEQVYRQTNFKQWFNSILVDQWRTIQYMVETPDQDGEGERGIECICSQPNLEQLFYIINIRNGNRLLVGSVCINKLGSADMIENTKLVQRCKHCNKHRHIRDLYGNCCSDRPECRDSEEREGNANYKCCHRCLDKTYNNRKRTDKYCRPCVIAMNPPSPDTLLIVGNRSPVLLSNRSTPTPIPTPTHTPPQERVIPDNIMKLINSAAGTEEQKKALIQIIMPKPKIRVCMDCNIDITSMKLFCTRCIPCHIKFKSG